MKQNSFTYDQLIDCAKGVLFGKGNAQLPMPPMLMFDRITSINENGGLFAKGEVIAHFGTDKMEFGARALGNRSILADPRNQETITYINKLVKMRDFWMPFAPSILREDVNKWFEHDSDSPYMLLVAEVKKDKRILMTKDEKALFGIEKLNVPRSIVPAITHVDYTARIQTVHANTNPLYHRVILKFKEMTGCPILVNTSFNVRGEPIVCTPTDAFKCFMGTELDLLVIGNFLLIKENQKNKTDYNYKVNYNLD